MYHKLWNKQRRSGKCAAEGLSLAAALGTISCATDALHWRIVFDHHTEDKREVRLYFPQAIIRAFYLTSDSARCSTDWKTGRHSELFCFNSSTGYLTIGFNWDVNVCSAPVRMSVRYANKHSGRSKYASIYLVANDDDFDKQILEDTVGSLAMFAYTGEDDAESVVNSLVHAKNTQAAKLDAFTSLHLRRDVERWNLFLTRIAQQRYRVRNGRLVLTLSKMMDWLNAISRQQQKLFAGSGIFTFEKR